MNLQEFAEQIVFGKTLEEKLARPERITDTPKATTVSSMNSIRSPGRAAGLQMHEGRGLSQLPEDRDLGSERERGRLLHFLANHELLATELMALVLLKFPDAPHAFRRGVLVTLQEEQEHTRMYLRRMRECGVEFGSYPLSGYFWRMVEPMRGPIDFVSRLSLTFEQANLDYSRHFASVLRQLGDDDTAAIMDQIYRDEISHVRHGLQWFRQWKQQEQSDWEAYCANLQFPMSPQRARGPRCEFNRVGRREAGLTDEFIDAVEVFRQSRGRPPTVRWFDAGAESSLRNMPSAKESRLLERLNLDLECLLIWLAKQDDVQVVRRMPSLALRKRLLSLGVTLPEFVVMEDVDTLAERKLERLTPWAWTPESHRLADRLREATRESPPDWNPQLRELYRKSWSCRLLQRWFDEAKAGGTPKGSGLSKISGLSKGSGASKADGDADLGVPDCFASFDYVGRVVECSADVVEAVDWCSSRGYESVIIKQDLATAGRGQRRVRCDRGLTDQDLSWLETLFATSTHAIVEPELDRVMDLSFLWSQVAGGQDAFSGWTRQLVTSGRRYAGTRLRRPFADCDAELKRFLLADDQLVLRQTRDWLAERLVPLLRRAGLSGAFGIDAFVFRDALGQLKIRPLVELNPRLTMGHIALQIQQQLAPAVRGEFRIFTQSEWRQVSSAFAEIELAMANDGRWQSGVIRLTDKDEDAHLVPAVLVGEAALSVKLQDSSGGR